MKNLLIILAIITIGSYIAQAQQLKVYYTPEGKYGLMNKEKTKVTEAEFDKIWLFDDLLCAFVKKGEKYAIINSISGKMVTDFIYSFIERNDVETISNEGDSPLLSSRTYGTTADGLVVCEKGTKEGVFDLSQGKEVVPCIYEDIDLFFCDLYIAVNQGAKKQPETMDDLGRWWFLNKSSYQKINNLQYNSIEKYNKDYGFLYLPDKVCLVNRSSLKEIIPFHSHIEAFYGFRREDFLVANFHINKNIQTNTIDSSFTIGIYGYNGIVILPVEFHWIGEENAGLIPISKNNKYGFVDLNGRIIIPLIYDGLYQPTTGNPKLDETIRAAGGLKAGFNNGLACMLKGDLIGFIDDMGNVAIPFIYDNVEKIIGDDNRYAHVIKNGEKLTLSKKGVETKGWN